MARPRIRAYSNKRFDLYPVETNLGWRVIRNVSYAEGEQMVAQGLWCYALDELGRHVGYQILALYRNDLDPPSDPTNSGISESEMNTNAGTDFEKGCSKTFGMSEVDRLSRGNHYVTGKALPPEDYVERVTAKVRVWPEVESQAGDILRVWPKK